MDGDRNIERKLRRFEEYEDMVIYRALLFYNFDFSGKI